MLMNQMDAGQQANLQLVWQEHILELNTTIVGMTKEGPLIKPYRYHGEIVDFTDVHKTDIVMNLFYTNPADQERLGWVNVKLTRMQLEDKVYYLVTPNPMGTVAHNAERRNYNRVPLNFKGTVTDVITKETYTVSMVDVNCIGVAFLIDDVSKLGTNLIVSFEDIIQEKKFVLRLDGMVVRKEETEEGIIVGCRLRNVSNNDMMYIYLKSVDNRRNKENDEATEIELEQENKAEEASMEAQAENAEE